MSSKFNYDFNFKDVTLDKLYKGDNSNVKLNLAPNTKYITLNNSNSKFNSHGDISTCKTETIDLSSEKTISTINNTNDNVNNNSISDKFINKKIIPFDTKITKTAETYNQTGLIDVNTYESIINNLVNICQSTIEQKKKELKKLEEDFVNFMTFYNADGTGLLGYQTPTGRFPTPDELKLDANAIYTIQQGKGVDYATAREIHIKYVNETYIPLFNKHLKKEMGMTYEEYLQKKSDLENAINELSRMYYPLKQEQKLLPYLKIEESAEYKNWLENKEKNRPKITMERDSFWGDKIFVNGVETDPRNVDPMLLGDAIVSGDITNNSVYFLGDTLPNKANYYYLTQGQRNMYSFLYETKGKEKAEEYITAIEDSINQAKAIEEVNFILERCTLDGRLNVDTLSLQFWEGVESGVINFGEGITHSFASEGIKSANDYKTMFLMYALKNTRNAYINEITTDIYNSKGIDDAEIFYNKIYNSITGEIDLNYAKSCLTESQYKELEVRINADKSFATQLYTGGYEIGTSFGNMLPSMSLALLTHGTSFATFGKILGFGTMGVSAAGNAYNEALIQGNYRDISRLYGVLSGLSEVTLDILLGNIPGLNENAAFSIKGLLSEGIEEGLQTYIGAGLNSVVLGVPINLNDYHGEALKAFLHGMILSGVTNGINTTYKVMIGSNYMDLSFSNLIELYKLASVTNIDIKTDSNGKKMLILDENIDATKGILYRANKVFPDIEVVQKFIDGTIGKPIIKEDVWDMQMAIASSNSTYIDSLINDSDSSIFYTLADEDIKIAVDEKYEINNESLQEIKSNQNKIEDKADNTSSKESAIIQGPIAQELPNLANVSSEKIARIKKKNDSFSLEEFYGASDGEAAIIFMTENQVVNLKCGMHEQGLRDAISGIYDIGLTNKIVLGSINENMYESLRDSNIHMRLVSGHDLCLMLPDKISRSQYEVFKTYVDKNGETLKEISRSIDPTGDGVLHFWNNTLGDEVITHDLQEAVKYAETIIDDSIELSKEKNVIGYTIEDLITPKINTEGIISPQSPSLEKIDLESQIKEPINTFNQVNFDTSNQSINNTDQMFTYLSKGNGSYGIDQGLFRIDN